MQTDGEDGAAQVVTIRESVPALERMARAIAEQDRATLEALQGFVDDPSLQQLRELRDQQDRRWDFFHVLGIQDSELAHSNFLAWLLDPNQSHGLGAYFLKSFLVRTCLAAAKTGLPHITTAKIGSIDWAETELRREWQYIDLLILNRKAKFVCAIENKIWADEGIGPDGRSQLTWYRETLKRNFPNFDKHYVFLSPSGIPSQIAEERQYWMPETYVTVRELVQRVLDQNAGVLSIETDVFLRHYSTMLGRNIVPESTEVQRLAREIYLKHREAFELIYQNKPNFRDDMKQIIKEAISKYTDWKLHVDDPSFVYFQPLEFTEWAGMQPEDSHARYSLACCQFQCPQEGNARFRIEIVPEIESNKSVRDKVVACINQHPNIFNRAGQNSTGWMAVHVGDNVLDQAELSDWDGLSLRAKIEAWVANFAENQFPAMNEVIVNCLREYEAEAQG